MEKGSDRSVPAAADRRPELRPGAWDDVEKQAPRVLFDGVATLRVLAYLLDLFIIFAVGIGLWIAFIILGVLSFGLLTPIGVVATAFLPLAYHSYFIGRQGATPGMRFLGLEVRTAQGARPDFVQAFIMTVLFYITVSVTFWLVLVVSLFNERRRTLHDILSGTIVRRAG